MSRGGEPCPGCGTQWGRRVLACPGCGRLVHKDELARLAAQAKAAPDDTAALDAWRAALSLLPPTSSQARRISARVEQLAAAQTQQPGTPKEKSKVPTWLASLGGFGLLVWKAKAILLFVATKGKLLFASLASWQSLLSMVLAFGVYWAAWGWSFALGVMLSLYVHELGHVVALRRYGIPASAPMFIPGVGAFVRLGAAPKTPVEDARSGLAGPWFGLAAALVAGGLHLLTQEGVFFAIAQVGAWINLFNLLPVWQLDGARGFASLTRKQRYLAAAAVGAAWLVSGEHLLGLILLAALFRAAFVASPEEGDRWGLAQYVVLIAAHASLASLELP